jgi:hypothetical protein
VTERSRPICSSLLPKPCPGPCRANSRIRPSCNPFTASLLSRNETPLTSFENNKPDAADEKMNPGEERLFSFYYKLSLKAGVYSATIRQEIHIKSDGGDGPQNNLKLESSQQFRVVLPRFASRKVTSQASTLPQGTVTITKSYVTLSSMTPI